MCTSKIINLTVLLVLIACVMPNAHAMQREERMEVEPKNKSEIIRSASVNAAGSRIIYYREQLGDGTVNIVNYFETGPEADSYSGTTTNSRGDIRRMDPLIARFKFEVLRSRYEKQQAEMVD